MCRNRVLTAREDGGDTALRESDFSRSNKHPSNGLHLTSVRICGTWLEVAALSSLIAEHRQQHRGRAPSRSDV